MGRNGKTMKNPQLTVDDVPLELGVYNGHCRNDTQAISTIERPSHLVSRFRESTVFESKTRVRSFWSHVRESHQVFHCRGMNGPFIGWFVFLHVDSMDFSKDVTGPTPLVRARRACRWWLSDVETLASDKKRPEWWIALNIYRKPRKFAPSNQGNPNAIGLPSQTTSISRDLSKCHLPKLVCRCKGYWSLLNIICHDLWFWMIRTCWNVSSRNCCYEPCKEPHYSKNVQTNYVLCWGIDTAIWHSYQPSRKKL